jgi:hypothetical protein
VKLTDGARQSFRVRQLAVAERGYVDFRHAFSLTQGEELPHALGGDEQFGALPDPHPVHASGRTWRGGQRNRCVKEHGQYS